MTYQQLDHSEGAASAYRVYLLGENGKIANSISVMADNDEDAIKQARAIAHHGGIELWDRGRVIFRLGKTGIGTEQPIMPPG